MGSLPEVTPRKRYITVAEIERNSSRLQDGSCVTADAGLTTDVLELITDEWIAEGDEIIRDNVKGQPPWRTRQVEFTNV